MPVAVEVLKHTLLVCDFHEALTLPHFKRISLPPSPSTAWKRSSRCFVFSFLDRVQNCLSPNRDKVPRTSTFYELEQTRAPRLEHNFSKTIRTAEAHAQV